MIKSASITCESSRDWISRHELALQSYLRQNHNPIDHATVFNLLYYGYPDEGKKLLINHNLMEYEKKLKLIKWVVHSPQITCLVLGDQGMGKDSLMCKFFEGINNYCKINNMAVPLYATLGNVKIPPFVHKENRCWNLKDIPFGSKFQPVFIYSSELEAEFPARDFQGQENKAFALLQNTFRHNHQKLFGCVKLTANIDISVLRTCNVKLFKYISPEKLIVEGVERSNFISDLGKWFLPNDVNDKSKFLMCFDNNLLTAHHDLPSFWTDSYSEQFKGGSISKKDIFSFMRSKFSDKEKLTTSQIDTMQTLVYNKLREKVTPQEVKDCFNFTAKTI